MKTKIFILSLCLGSFLNAQTWGPSQVVSPEGVVVNSTASCRLSNDTIVFAYADAAQTNAKVTVCRMKQGKLEPISTLTLDEDNKTAGAAPLALSRLDDNRFVLLYQDFPPLGRALVGELTPEGELRWAGPSVVFSLPNKAIYMDLITIDPETVLITFFGDSDKMGRVMTAKISNGSLVPGPAASLAKTYVNHFNSLALLSPNEFVLSFAGGGSLGGQAMLINGRIAPDGTVTLSVPFQVDSMNSPYTQVIPAGGNRCLVGYLNANGLNVALVEVNSGNFNVVSRQTAPYKGALLSMDSLGSGRFVMTLRHDASNRDSPVLLGEIKGSQIEISELATKQDGASLQQITTLHSKVVVLSHAANGNRLEATAMAVTK